MNIGVIGSTAARLWPAYNSLQGVPNDLDLVSTYDDIHSLVRAIKAHGEPVLAQYPINAGKKVFIRTSKRIIEVEIAWPGSSAEALLELIMSETGTGVKMYGITLMAPRLDVLYMLKMSHRYLKNSVHFIKTMQDIHYMRAIGCKIRPEHEAFYKARTAATYDYSHPKLNQSKGEFFTDDVPYVYDHDSIHEAIKHLDKPAYSYFKPDESEVMVSREMFDKLDEEAKLYSVLEEAYVLAIERSQVPFPATDPKRSFDIALMKVCTSITSGWWREYAWENYNKVMAMYDPYYVFIFREAVIAGKVRLHSA